MTLLSAWIILLISLFFYGSVKWFILPRILKKNPDTQIITFSWITGIVCLISLGVLNFVFSAVNLSVTYPLFVGFLFLTGFAFLLMPFLLKKDTKWQILVLFLLCLSGTFLIPPPSGEFITPANTAIRFGGALFWCSIILINTVLDRIPLFSYITNTCAFVILSLSCATFVGIVPYTYFYSFILIILLNMFVFCIYRKTGILVYTFPLVFLFNWIIGYVLLHFMYTVQAVYIPLFFSFSLMEILVAVGINLYTNKRLFPITISFVTEKAFELNLPLKSIVKKLFYTTFVIMFLSMLAIKVAEIKMSVLYIYMIAFVVLYSSYRLLSGQSESTSFWGALKDVKTGMGVLANELSTVVSQTAEKLKNKLQENQSSDEKENVNKHDSDKTLVDDNKQ